MPSFGYWHKMTNPVNDPTLTGLAQILQLSICGPVILWGEEALRKHGAPIDTELDQDVMLVLEDEDAMLEAGQRLREGNFLDAPWSFGSDAERRLPLDEISRRQIMTDFSFFDLHTCRFVYRLPLGGTIKVCLIPSSYAHLSASTEPAENFDSVLGFLLPKAKPLLTSFVRTLVCEPMQGSWKKLLSAWASCWLYIGKNLPDNIMDDCKDKEAKRYFMNNIRCSRPIIRSQHITSLRFPTARPRTSPALSLTPGSSTTTPSTSYFDKMPFSRGIGSSQRGAEEKNMIAGI